MPNKFIYNDGGRDAAGYKGTTGDCVCRAIAIALEKPYQDVYADLISFKERFKQTKRIRTSHPRTGVSRKIYDAYLRSYGWKWYPTMTIGSGCKVHLNASELPRGRIVVRLSKHLAAVVDGVLHDIHDSSRNKTRCVYGYYAKASERSSNAKATPGEVAS